LLFLKHVYTIVDHFSEMSQVVLVHQLEKFTIQARPIFHKCDLFTDSPLLAASPYTVHSHVSLTDFGEFVSVLEGNAVTITNDNFRGLSALCDEFRFNDLAAAISQFRDSDDFKEAETIKDSEARRRLSLLEERMQRRDDDIASLQCELLRRLQAQESSTEGVVERVSLLEADRAVVVSLSTEMARLKEFQSLLSGQVEKVRQQFREAKESADNANDIGFATRAVAEEAQKRVAEVQSEVETHRNALGEVRALAERAQTKAASAEAHLGRVGRLEGEVSALRIEPVVPALEELEADILVLRAAHAGWNSVIVPDFPKLFEDLKKKRFTLLWRGSRDGFRADEFHRRCDGHANTLTVILDTDGNIFGGFTPVEWESSKKHWLRDGEAFSKSDPSLTSFLFTLKNPHSFPPRRFTLKEEKKEEAIRCDSNRGPHFGEIMITDNCNANTDSSTSSFGTCYTNDTRLDGSIVFTGCSKFKVKEIEVFEIGPGGSEIGTLQMLELPTRKLESRAFWDFPAIFEEFREKEFTLLWRCSRDGFGAGDFHSRCDGHPNTLTVILDTKGNIFGGFTPVEWESRTPNSEDDWSNCFKADPSLKSFLFTLRNPHNVPARRFGLNAKMKDDAICCNSDYGPHFQDIVVYDNSNANTDSYTYQFGDTYTNDTGLDGNTFFTGSEHFQVKEIEVFEITD
jgi:hypothetical protein